MYPPASQVIKTQTFTRQKGRVFHPTSTDLNTRKPEGKNAGKGTVERYDGGRGNSNRWTNRSTGSTGGSTSPSISSPLSRTSSAGSNNEERPGSSIARQGAVIVQQMQQPLVPMQHLPTNNVAPPKNTIQSLSQGSNSIPSSSRSSKGTTKPFNHKEVVDYMNRAFQEAKKAIEAGHGKMYDPRDHDAPIDFKPFDWEDFWQQRKLKGL